MTVNCYTSGDFCLHSNTSCFQENDFSHCFSSQDVIRVYGTLVIATAFIFFPICLLIFYLGIQKWRRLRSLNNTDFLTINFGTLKLMVFLGHLIIIFCLYFKCFNMVNVGYGFWSISWHGENLFHFVTCIDRYLAVVHPIIYIQLRSQQWKRLRSITIGCIWMLSFGTSSLMMVKKVATIFGSCLLVLSLILVTFLNVSILCILRRPGPGKPRGNKDRHDHAKQRALYTITSILGVLFLRFGWNLVWFVSEIITEKVQCMFFIVGILVEIPSSLVLPFLFLQKKDTVKLCLCCKKNIPEGELN